MYKFNLLSKINIAKQQQKEIDKIVNMVFYSALSIAVVLVLVIIIKSFIVGGSLSKYNDKLSVVEADLNKLKADKNYLPNDKLGIVYNYFDKKIVWTRLITALESNLDSLSSLEELSFNGTQIDCKVLVRATDKDNSKAGVLRIMTAYQESLAKDSLFVSFLKDNKGSENILMVEQPNFKQDGTNLWNYRLQFNTREIIKSSKEVGNENNMRRRF